MFMKTTAHKDKYPSKSQFCICMDTWSLL